MPHCELHYSDNLEIDAKSLLVEIERVVNEHDPSARECKGRAFPTGIYHRPHLKVTVSMLTRPYRDEAFTQALMADLESCIKAQIAQSCYFSLLVEYSSDYYVTNDHVVEGDELIRYLGDSKTNSR